MALYISTMLAVSRNLAPAARRVPAISLSHSPVTRRLQCRTCQRHFLSSRLLSSNRRTPDFNSGFTGSYDPNEDAARGPMFNKSSFGVPKFYPRDLKKQVDDYVVGQDRAKKSICATIFNHYQNLRRRHQHEQEERSRKDKLLRQRLARDRELHQRRRDAHPAEGQRLSERPLYEQPANAHFQDEFPGHFDNVRHLQQQDDPFDDDPSDHFYTPEDTSAPKHVKIDKSNMLLVGPTGVGKTYILEYGFLSNSHSFLGLTVIGL